MATYRQPIPLHLPPSTNDQPGRAPGRGTWFAAALAACLLLVPRWAGGPPSARGADESEAAWDGKEQGVRAYPLGPLGGRAHVHIGKPDFEVIDLDENAPGYRGGLRVGDRIVGANGRAFDAYDNDPYSGGKGGPEGLGNAIEACEAGRKPLKLDVVRGDARKQITISLKAVGGLSPNWPLDACAKLQKFQEGICEHLSRTQGGNGHWTTGYGTGADWVTTALAGLALLGSGEPRYADNARKAAEFFMQQDPAAQGSNWAIYYSGVFLCEYFLCTNDEKAKAFIRTGVATLESRVNPANGSFGHGTDPVSSGYGGSGINIVATGVFWFWAMASRCGIQVSEATWEKVLDHLAHSTGRNGGIAYTRMPSSGNANHNSHGRTAHTLMALTLTGQAKPYAKDLLRYLRENPGNVRENHAYSCPAVMATLMALFMADREAYRKQLDAFTWYFTLARSDENIAQYIGSKRNSGGDQYLKPPILMNACVGVILAAHQQRLFMYGNLPGIPGVVPAELSPTLARIYRELGEEDCGETIRRLERYAAGRADSTDTTAAKAMLAYLMDTRIKAAWSAVDECRAKGDLWKAYTGYKEFLSNYGRVSALAPEVARLENELRQPDAQTLLRRGKAYYDIVEAWEKYPAKRELVLAEFEKFGAGGDDLYSRRARKTVEVVRERDAQKRPSD